jgi:hypothetical protein
MTNMLRPERQSLPSFLAEHLDRVRNAAVQGRVVHLCTSWGASCPEIPRRATLYSATLSARLLICLLCYRRLRGHHPTFTSLHAAPKKEYAEGQRQGKDIRRNSKLKTRRKAWDINKSPGSSTSSTFIIFILGLGTTSRCAFVGSPTRKCPAESSSLARSASTGDPVERR